MSSSKRWSVRAGYLSVISIYFLWLTRAGLAGYFNFDDVMNMFKEWVRPLPESLHASVAFWGGEVRPLGQLAYRILYDLFGWNPRPFRTACFAAMVFNLALGYLLYLRVTKSDRVAAIALLAGCYHGAMLGIYTNTGTLYDILAQSFMLGVLLLYTGIESSSWWRTALMCLLTIAAIQTKEMGFALPLLAAAYEAVFYKSNRGRWPALMAITAVCAIGFLGLRFGNNGIHFQHPAYTPELSVHRYLETTRAHLGLLLFGAIDLTNIAAVGILLGTFALALLMRSRMMIFGWLYFNLALLPLSFTTPRADAYVLYIPLTGFALWVAGLAGQWAETSRVKWTVTAVLVTAILMTQAKERQKDDKIGFGSGGETDVRTLTQFTATEERGLHKDAVIAIINDPLESDWQPSAIVRMMLDRHDIQVDRITCPSERPWAQCLARPLAGYESIVLYNGKRYVEVRRR